MCVWMRQTALGVVLASVRLPRGLNTDLQKCSYRSIWLISDRALLEVEKIGWCIGSAVGFGGGVWMKCDM